MTPNEILIEITDEFAIALIETIDYGLRLGHFADDIRLRDHAKSSQIIIASSTLDFEVRRSQIEERYKELGLVCPAASDVIDRVIRWEIERRSLSLAN